MVLKEDGTFDSEGEDNNMPPLEEASDGEYAEEGLSLINRRVLNVQAKIEDDQRESIFQTRCRVQGRVCNMLIDGGSCTNVASIEMVEKLGLKTTKHPKPYKLQWLSDCGELKVTRQVNVPFSIGRYKDEVTCDVVAMQAGHILLGRPWQYDRSVVHDGQNNRYSFKMNERKITLVPMTPRQIFESEKNHKKIEKDQGALEGKRTLFSTNICFSKVSNLFVGERKKKVLGSDTHIPYTSKNFNDARSDSRTNRFKEGGNDTIPRSKIEAWGRDGVQNQFSAHNRRYNRRWPKQNRRRSTCETISASSTGSHNRPSIVEQPAPATVTGPETRPWMLPRKRPSKSCLSVFYNRSLSSVTGP